MSLVNLAHVCSHLQNASLARLGLTSIPYTKLHLSLALLLHKQGFLSQVKLGGPSPPASCFPPGTPDNNRISGHPHAERSTHSGISALTEIVMQGKRKEDLQAAGFDDEAIQFAEERRELSKEQLESDGWDAQVLDFLMQNGMKSQDQLEDEQMAPEAIQILQRYSVPYTIQRIREDRVKQMERKACALLRKEGFDAETLRYFDIDPNREELGNDDKYKRVIEFLMQHRHKSVEELEEEQMPPEDIWILEEYSVAKKIQHLHETGQGIGQLNEQEMGLAVRNMLREEGFDADTLKYFASDQRYLTQRRLQQDGLSVEAMGLSINNQPITTLPASYRDSWGLESEGVVTQANRASRRLWLGLKYWDGVPVLRKARMLSKPTKRIWLNSHELGKVVRGKQAGEIRPLTQVGEIMAVSTDRGILEARECVERKTGGMVLCRIW